MNSLRIVILLWFLILTLGLGWTPARAEKAAAPRTEKIAAAEEIKSIQISFRMEEINPQSFYMGNVWVSPPEFNATQRGKELSVKVRAAGLSTLNRQMPITPFWVPENTSMVMANPSQGPETTLTVFQEGESGVMIRAGNASKRLKIRASYRHNLMYVTITQ